jgi:hypothetical protein
VRHEILIPKLPVNGNQTISLDSLVDGGALFGYAPQ